MGKQFKFNKADPKIINKSVTHSHGYGEGTIEGKHLIFYYDKTANYQAKKTNTLIRLGYYMISKTIAGPPSNLRYAAVWIYDPSKDQRSFTVTGFVAYMKKIEDFKKDGYHAHLISVSGTDALKAKYSGTVLKPGPGITEPLVTPVMISTGDPDTKLYSVEKFEKEAQSKKRHLSSISAFGTAKQPLFAAIWSSNLQVEQWATGYNETIAKLRTRTQAHAKHKAYRSQIIAGPGPRYCSLFDIKNLKERTSFIISTKAGFQKRINTHLKSGKFPLFIDAYVKGQKTYYTAFMAQLLTPIAPKVTLEGKAEPFFNLWDTKILDRMQAYSVKSASLAITYQGRLVYARAYNRKQEEEPLVKPDALFRTASLTKVITAIAIHRLMEEKKININDSFSKYVPTDNDGNTTYPAIKVGHVLSHTATFQRSHGGTKAIETALGIERPVDVHARRGYCRLQKLKTKKLMGLSYSYSNLGYTLLGQLIEEVTGMPYDDYIKQIILEPLGLKRPQIGTSWGDLPGEIRYQPNYLKLGPSAFVKETELASVSYEGDNYGLALSSGGYVLAAVDMAKIVSAFHSNVNNPLLGEKSVKLMRQRLIPTGSYTVNYGWIEKAYDIFGGTKVYSYDKGGAYNCVSTWLSSRTDDTSFVLFMDRAGGAGKLPGDFSELLNTSSRINYPSHDLFPTYGIPSF